MSVVVTPARYRTLFRVGLRAAFDHPGDFTGPGRLR